MLIKLKSALAPAHEYKNGAVPQPSKASHIGGWLPPNPHLIQQHAKEVLVRANAAQLAIAPPIKALQELLSSNSAVFMLFTEMLTEVPASYTTYPGGEPNAEIRTVPDLIQALNYQIQSPIQHNDSILIGQPINGILDWPMATKAGFAAFLRDDVNRVFQAMLNYWGDFLKSQDSVSSVTTQPGGWLSPIAQSSGGLKNFLETYQVPDWNDPVHYGFTSWDQFFTRRFLPGLRPLASPSNDNVIVSATESIPFYIQTNVQLRDTFWVKNKDQRSNYSLVDMLGDEELAKKFVGGTVYQAFLCADSYHRWHAPVSGHYTQTPKIINGAYYSEPVMWSFEPDEGHSDPDPGADDLSQGYISAIAKRGVAVIQADNPSIGLMAVVMIGMAEVSSVDFFDLPNGFKKGDEIGTFHFGGSTHCLVFGPNVRLDFAATALPAPDVKDFGPPVQVLSELARVRQSTG